MSVDRRGLRAMQQRIRELEKEVPAIMEELIVGEGVYAVKQAKSICKSEPGLVNTGSYRNHFHAGNSALTFDGANPHDGSRPGRFGTSYRIDVYNNLEYAKPLEYGFRSHFVPGHWEGRTFVYQPKDPQGGMYVGPPGGYVRGHFTLLRAVQQTRATQSARLNRKINRIIRERLG